MTEVSLKQRVGEEITKFFIIRGIETRTKKSDNEPYLVLELGYQQGRIWANIWENTDAFLAEYQAGDVVKIRGVVEQYRDMTQLNIRKIRKSAESDDVHPEDLLPVYPGDLNKMKKLLPKYIKKISNSHLQALCTSILLEDEFNTLFCKAPAGKLWHHGYVGGLLEHTLKIVDLCESIAAHYPQLNPDLLRAGALLHDVGKVETYTTVPYIEYSDEGRLIGHIVLGYERVREAIKMSKDFPEEIAKQLLHLIISHQGELAKASPVVPMTLEGIILHLADEIDSTINAFQRIIDEQKTPHKKWSSYVNLIDRFIYLGGLNKNEK